MFLLSVLCLWVFLTKLDLVRGKFIPAGLHAAEASYVSSSSISPSGLLLFVLYGPPRCLWLILLPF